MDDGVAVAYDWVGEGGGESGREESLRGWLVDVRRGG